MPMILWILMVRIETDCGLHIPKTMLVVLYVKQMLAQQWLKIILFHGIISNFQFS